MVKAVIQVINSICLLMVTITKSLPAAIALLASSVMLIGASASELRKLKNSK